MKVYKKYVADDGTEFNSEPECMKYEAEVKSRKFQDTALLFDEEGKRLPLTSNKFGEALIILAKTDEAAEYMYCELSQGWASPWDDSPDGPKSGCWIYNIDEWVSAKDFLQLAKMLERIINM